MAPAEYANILSLSILPPPGCGNLGLKTGMTWQGHGEQTAGGTHGRLSSWCRGMHFTMKTTSQLTAYPSGTHTAFPRYFLRSEGKKIVTNHPQGGDHSGFLIGPFNPVTDETELWQKDRGIYNRREKQWFSTCSRNTHFPRNPLDIPSIMKCQEPRDLERAAQRNRSLPQDEKCLFTQEGERFPDGGELILTKLPGKGLNALSVVLKAWGLGKTRLWETKSGCSKQV